MVRRIFRELAAGIGPRTIARTLNEEGPPGPEGRLWSDTTVQSTGTSCDMHGKRRTVMSSYHPRGFLTPAGVPAGR